MARIAALFLATVFATGCGLSGTRPALPETMHLATPSTTVAGAAGQVDRVSTGAAASRPSVIRPADMTTLEFDAEVFAIEATPYHVYTFEIALRPNYRAGAFNASDAVVIKLSPKDRFFTDGLGLKTPEDWSRFNKEMPASRPKFHVHIERDDTAFGANWQLTSWNRITGER